MRRAATWADCALPREWLRWLSPEGDRSAGHAPSGATAPGAHPAGLQRSVSMSRSSSSRLPYRIDGGCSLVRLVTGPFRLEAAVGAWTRDTASDLCDYLCSVLSLRAASIARSSEGPRRMPTSLQLAVPGQTLPIILLRKRDPLHRGELVPRLPGCADGGPLGPSAIVLRRAEE